MPHFQVQLTAAEIQKLTAAARIQDRTKSGLLRAFIKTLPDYSGVLYPSNSKQQTANSKQQTANSKQQTANSKQQTANSKQQTASSKQQTASSNQNKWRVCYT